MKIEIEIADKVVTGLLCSAFEGGSNYWLRSIEMCVPKDISPGADKDRVIRRENLPLVPGGMLVFHLREEAHLGKGLRYTMTLHSLIFGLHVMSKVSAEQFGRAIAGRGDAETGDVFLQCCLFGEVIFG